MTTQVDKQATMPGANSAADDATLARWIDEAVRAAASIGEAKFARIRQWFDSQNEPGRSVLYTQLSFPAAELLPGDPDEMDLHRDVVLAAHLRGRLATEQQLERRADERVVASAESLFDRLPFRQAIRALAERLGITKEEFIELDRAARSRAFTMASVGDEQIVKAVHAALNEAVANGEDFGAFQARLEKLQETSGWTGTSPWHYRLVYDQNVSMSYTAGRFDQGTQRGLVAWRYLPSISMEPRAEHRAYYGRIFRAAPGRPMPPIDFNCTCGWEWVFPDELEKMDIDPATLPEFDPPTPKSGFAWSVSDYVAAKDRMLLRDDARMQAMRPQMQDATIRKCSAVAIDAAPASVLLVPWGQVASESGDFVLDDDAVAQIIAAFSDHGVHVPIDYEHQTVGGEFAAPSGQAPAAGWIQALHAVPGQGLFGTVEWTDQGRQRITAKEYRYLSPVVIVRKSDGRAIALHSAALTNKPAIPSMPALVNKAATPADDTVDMTPEGRLLKAIGDALGLEGTVTADGLAAVLRDRAAAAKAKGGDGAAYSGLLAAIADFLAPAAGDEEVVASTAHGARLVALKAENAALRRQVRDREWNELITAHAGRIPPVAIPAFRKWWEKSPDEALVFLKTISPLVNVPLPPWPGKGDPARAAKIADASGGYDNEKKTRRVLCTRRAWIDMELQRAGLPAMCREEVAVHAADA